MDLTEQLLRESVDFWQRQYHNTESRAEKIAVASAAITAIVVGFLARNVGALGELDWTGLAYVSVSLIAIGVLALTASAALSLAMLLPQSSYGGGGSIASMFREEADEERARRAVNGSRTDGLVAALHENTAAIFGPERHEFDSDRDFYVRTTVSRMLLLKSACSRKCRYLIRAIRSCVFGVISLTLGGLLMVAVLAA